MVLDFGEHEQLALLGVWLMCLRVSRLMGGGYCLLWVEGPISWGWGCVITRRGGVPSWRTLRQKLPFSFTAT